MSFNLQTNAKELSFDYRAIPVKQQYSGVYSLNNFQTEATFFGKYLSFTPTCQQDALNAVEAWFQEPLGIVTHFSCFGDLTNGRLIAGNYSWTAEVGVGFSLLLKSWKLVGAAWVRQPYIVSNARPISSNLTIVNNRFTAIPGSPITTLKFGFQITPELTSIKYTRNGGRVTFEDIPFLVVPKSAWV